MGAPESKLIKAALEYLGIRGVFAWRNNSGAVRAGKRFVRFGKTGSPDIIGILPGGRFLGVECKTGRQRLTRDQHVFATNVRAAGARWITCYALEDIEEALDRDA